MTESHNKRLAARNLTKSFRRRKVVDNVSIDFACGEVVGLLGPNGAGKTTSFYMIVGLISADSGEVYLGDTDVTKMKVYERARAGIGYLPQETSVFRDLTVRQNLELVLEERGASKSEIASERDRLLEEFGLTRLADEFGYSLSGGERRRVEIARALVNKPDFILLDEPFSGIDPIAVSEIQEIIRQLKSRGFGVMITDHNVRDTLAITDRAYLIHLGQILVQGKPSEIASNEMARKFYLGERFSL